MRIRGEQNAKPEEGLPHPRFAARVGDNGRRADGVSAHEARSDRGRETRRSPARGEDSYVSGGIARTTSRLEDRLDPGHRLVHRLLVAPLLRNHAGDGLAPDVLGIDLGVGRVVAVVEGAGRILEVLVRRHRNVRVLRIVEERVRRHILEGGEPAAVAMPFTYWSEVLGLQDVLDELLGQALASWRPWE